jgi:hypothetical protein
MYSLYLSSKIHFNLHIGGSAYLNEFPVVIEEESRRLDMAESEENSDVLAAPGNTKHPIPKEHRSLDYLLSQIPRRAQKGFLSNCDLILQCVDANPEFIALGTNVGVVYLFDRKKELVERLKTHVRLFLKMVS